MNTPKIKTCQAPCDQCCFIRSIEPGNLGGSAPEVYIGQAQAGMWIPCHSTYEEGVHPKLQSHFKTRQCAGCAIYRSNCGITSPFAPVENLPADTEKVFASHAEFLAHHRGISVESAEMILSIVPPKLLAIRELSSASCQLRLVPAE